MRFTITDLSETRCAQLIGLFPIQNEQTIRNIEQTFSCRVPYARVGSWVDIRQLPDGTFQSGYWSNLIHHDLTIHQTE